MVRRLARRPARRPARTTRRRRVRLDNDARRAQLLQLARRAFSERAYDDVAIDDLARAAKISKGLLYHYFPTKRDLYVANLRDIAEQLVARVRSIPEDLPPLERVRAGLDAYLDHVSEHSRAFVSLMRGGIGSDPEVVRVIESVRESLFERLLAGSPLPPLSRIRTAMRGWIGFVESASIDWCADPQLGREELRELFAQTLIAIVAVVAPGALEPGAR